MKQFIVHYKKVKQHFGAANLIVSGNSAANYFIRIRGERERERGREGEKQTDIQKRRGSEARENVCACLQ